MHSESEEESDFYDENDTKNLPQFSFEILPSLSVVMTQQNNTQNHGTTVWDSAKVLAHYLVDTIKPPTWSLEEGRMQVQNTKTCIELGSGCGLGGLTMAALGLDTVVTDLPSVVDSVLQPNAENNMDTIKDWWHRRIEQSSYQHTRMPMDDPKLRVEPLDWVRFCSSLDGDEANKNYCDWVQAPYNYILAADCIYCIELVPTLLRCCQHLASHTTTILVALEHRDDIVVNNFVSTAKAMGFDTRAVPKRMLNSKVVGHEDIEIWKLKKKRTTK